MDNSFLQSAIDTDSKAHLKIIKELFDQLNLGQVLNQSAAYQNLRTLVADNADTVQQEIENFTFQIPPNSYANVIQAAGANKPRLGIHYDERNSVLYQNTAANAVNYRDADLVGWTARDELLTRQPESTQAQLQAAYDVARTAQERVNRTAQNTLPIWTLIQRENSNDIRQEDALLVFSDSKHSQPDWYAIVKNIKNFGEPLGYTLTHYRNVLCRFIGFFAPQLKPVTDELTAIELAKFLMRLNIPAPKFEKLTAQIQTLKREPTDNLRSVMAQLQAMATAIYTGKDDAAQSVNKLMITGLLSFTTGATKQALSTAVSQTQLQNKSPDFKVLLESVINSERIHGPPHSTLSFQSIQAPTTTLFNMHYMPIESPISHPYSPVEFGITPVHASYYPTEQPKYIPPEPRPRGPQPRPVHVPYRAPQNNHPPPPPIVPQPPVQPQQMIQYHQEPERVDSPPPVQITHEQRTTRQRSRNNTPENVRMVQIPTKPIARKTRKQKVYTESGQALYMLVSDSPTNSRPSSRSNSKERYPPPRSDSKNQQYRRGNTPDRYRPSSPSPRRNDKYQNSNNRSNSPYRPKTPQNDKYNNYPPQRSSRSPYRNNDPRNYPSRSKSPSQQMKSNHPRSRSATPSKYPGYLPGTNCSADYKPWNTKHCLKCCSKNEHHEYLCPTYYRYHPKKCPKCKVGYHYMDDCKEKRQGSRTPSLTRRYNPLN